MPYEPEDENDDFPLVPNDLLTALEQRFPDRLPTDLNTSDKAIWAAIGAAQVVRFLREMRQRVSRH
jgi:hypothetical protein